MGRPYGPEEFRDLVREISRRFPGAGLGLDVLVGFPGESAADFEATRSLVAELPVTYLHVFPYSPRPGTPAADLPPLPGNVVQERARIMRELGQAKKTQFLEAQLGQVREVLVEGPAAPEGWLQGLSDHYLRVTFPGPPAWRNRRVMVRFTGAAGGSAGGRSGGRALIPISCFPLVPKLRLGTQLIAKLCFANEILMLVMKSVRQRISLPIAKLCGHRCCSQ